MSKFDQHAMAATFAEAGEADSAREILGKSTSKKAAPPKHAPAKKPYLATVIFGVISLVSYVYVFSNEKLVTEVFTKGGAYAVWPLATAFYFSMVHGAFGSNLLSVLGLEAKKK